MPNGENEDFEFDTLKKMLETNARRYAIRKAFLLAGGEGEEEKHITFSRFHSHAERLCAALDTLNKKKEKKIVICMKNRYEWCVSYFACAFGAGTAVLLDSQMPPEEIANAARFAKADAFITDSSLVSKILGLKKKDRKFKIICVGDCEDESVIPYDSLLQKGKELIQRGAYAEKEIDPDKAAVLIFTSGTTGMAKAVMLSNRNICSDIAAVKGVVDISYDDSTLCVLPLHHTYQAIVMLTMLYTGGSVSFCENLRYVSSDMLRFKPTVFACVPLILEKTHAKILKKLSAQSFFKKSFTVGKAASVLAKISSSELKKKIYSQVHEAFGGRMRLIITGAAAINEDIVNDYEAFGFNVVIGYGLTECSPIAICNSSSDRRADSIGKPIRGAEVKIENADEDGVGEICVKGPMVMLGYYNNPEETSEVLKNGWLHTGDLGYCDDEGFYHITGRIKNVIIAKNGKNVYPEELEYYLNREPAVLESLIFSDDDENEQVTACVVPNEEAIKDELQKEKLTEEDIQGAISKTVRKVNKSLPSYKSIRRIRLFESELEKTATNKVKRNSKKNRQKGKKLLHDDLEEKGKADSNEQN